MTVRTRFAPSPTGYLHVGGARTALFCWLYARRQGGQFILRIEDTDRERSTPEAVQAILDGMAWLGLDCDEGPFYQTERMDRYQAVIEQLLDEGKAYCCYCTKQRLDRMREEQVARRHKPRYDGTCRDAPQTPGDHPFVVRFRNPQEGEVRFEDQVSGLVTFQNSELDDLIIARSDGSPTYNFTVVVDDIDMKITHVVRGSDHLNNTPRQINIFRALGVEPPVFAHVPMILGEDGKKLSKRHGAVSVMQYRDDGYLPDAMLNYLVRLGWSHGDQEIFSRDEMISLFDIRDINKSAAIFSHEKLMWLNQHYMKTDPPADVAEKLRWHFNQMGVDLTNGPALSEIVTIQAERCKTLKEMADKSVYFYRDFKSYDEKAVKHLKPDIKPVLQEVIDRLKALEDWRAESIHQIVIDVAEVHAFKLGKVAQPIRVAVTGGTISPPIDVTMRLIGKERVLKRLDAAIDSI